MLLARVLIGLVFLVNIQCAGAFLIHPAAYMHGFGLDSVVGEQMVRALGLLFVMWNVPYLVALWHPIRHRISLYEALAMQTIGLVGESIIYLTLPAIHVALRASVLRFIAFDALGLVLLLIAAWITREG